MGSFMQLIVPRPYAAIVLFMCIVNTESAADECFHSNSGVKLVSRIEIEGRTSACPGEVVVYTCTVANTGALQWAIESFHSIEDEPILFTVQYHPVGTVVQQEEGLFTANVTEIVLINVYWGNITSTLSIVARERVNNKKVWCSNSVLYEDESPCIVHKIGVLPSAPHFPSYTITSHDVATFSVLLQWSTPSNDGGVGISNYTTALQASHMLHTYVEHGNTLHLILPYNRMHTAQIFATNCMGNSPPVYVDNLSAVSCGVPGFSALSNNSDYSHATHEGSQITFLCIDDEEIFSIKCLNNTRWTPDPSEITCSDIKPVVNDKPGVHCKTPVLPLHSHTDKGRNVLGSVITYQCDSDYKPTEWMMSVCSSTGEWVSNITSFECNIKVDCGVPIAPVGGSVHYTDTGLDSKAVVQCDNGTALVGKGVSYILSICLGNGSWLPDTAMLKCSNVSTTETEDEKCMSPKSVPKSVYLHAITGAVVFIIAFPLGALSYLSVKYCKHRKQKQKTKNLLSSPAYEDVNMGMQDPKMIYNNAYGVHSTSHTHV